MSAAPKTIRYQIQSMIGRGATSLVYRAFDVEKHFTVALKSKRFSDMQNLYMLKTEFRALAQFYHPNVAQLYELHVDDESCFFTMELVEGTDFLSFVRGSQREPGPVSGAALTRLRRTLAQLFDGLDALHSDGKLHRDIKPSNVLVEYGGRTVLLDFGLASDLVEVALLESRSRFVAGTPAYMAPERLYGDPASVASDWYSVGVMLYEALTGEPPFPDASPFGLLEAKKVLPPHPALRNPDAPTDLADLTCALLTPDPRARPGAAEIRRVTHASSAIVEPNSALIGLKRQRRRVFVGREAELRRLGEAFARSRSGKRALTLVEGVSGIGKTSLIERFLTDAHGEHAALVLSAHCSFHETIAYNAIDGLVDSMSRFLMLQDPADLARLLPADFAALVRVFPVLERVLTTSPLPADRLGGEPLAIRRAAVESLEHLLDRIAAQRPLILWIDDFQWSDNASIPILIDLLRGGSCGIQVILSFRSEYRHPDDPIGSLTQALRDVPDAAAADHLRLEPLTPPQVAMLVKSAAGEPIDIEPWQDLLRDTLGLPFFALEIVAFLEAQQSEAQRWSGSDGGEAIRGIADIMQSRLASVSERARAVLEVAAVAGALLAEHQVLAITRDQHCTAADVHQLYLQHLLRKHVVGGQPAIECYHDRVRQAVLEALPAAGRQERHRQIADVLAADAVLDHERLAEHHLGAGQPSRAAEHALLAGREAAGRLAFDRAVAWFKLALEHHDLSVEAWPIQAELAAALADAGMLEEAADRFLATSLALSARGDERLRAADYKIRAGEQLLYCGLLSRGQAVMREVCHDLGLKFPATLGEARRMAIINRVWFAVQRAFLKVKDREHVRGESLLRLETLWGAGRGLIMLDYVVGDAMVSRYVREAGRIGERSQVVRALGLEAAVFANLGTPWSQRQSAALLGRAEAIAGPSGDPYERLVLAVCRAGTHWFAGRWRAAAETAGAAIELHRRERGRYDFELAIALGYRLSAMVLSGDLARARDETLAAVDDARRRGDQYIARLFLSGYWVYIGLADDEPEAVLEGSRHLLDDVPADRFTSLHWSYFNATANALMYAGEPWQAWSLVLRFWPLIERTGFLRLACIGSHLREIRARAALMAAAGAAAGVPPAFAAWTRHRLVAAAEADADCIRRAHTVAHAGASAAALDAGIATVRNEWDAARRLARSAMQGFGAAEMGLHRAAAAWQLSRLTVGGESASLRRSATAWLNESGVRDPKRLTDLVFPIARSSEIKSSET